MAGANQYRTKQFCTINQQLQAIANNNLKIKYNVSEENLNKRSLE